MTICRFTFSCAGISVCSARMPSCLLQGSLSRQRCVIKSCCLREKSCTVHHHGIPNNNCASVAPTLPSNEDFKFVHKVSARREFTPQCSGCLKRSVRLSGGAGRYHICHIAHLQLQYAPGRQSLI